MPEKNKQILNLIRPALDDHENRQPYNQQDEFTAIQVTLPKTGLAMKIVILRDREMRKNIRCFGTTNVQLSPKDILRKYRFRWIIENGIKGNKNTLQKMRNLLFEKRNCTIEQDHSGNLILTLLDWQNKGSVENHVSKMLLSLKEKGKNKVLWWNNRSIFLCAKNQYQFMNSVQ